MPRTIKNRGFTLVEMLVVAPIVILAIGAFLTAIISMTGEVLASRAANNLSYDVQDALNRIEQDVKLSSGFIAANTVIGTAQGRNDDTTAFSNTNTGEGKSLILNMIATTGNPLSSTTSYVYLKDKPNSCAEAQNINTPFTYNVVYFLKKDTATDVTSLYRRTLMPANYTDITNTVCTVPWQQPSCSSAYMDTQTTSVFCKTKDVELVKGVDPDNFIIQYFNNRASSENVTAGTSSSVTDRNTALQSVTTVGVTIKAKQTAAGRDVERTAVLQASRLDTNASSIGVITADSTPAAPKVSAKVGDATDVVISWQKSFPATGYTVQYQINSGGWVTGFSNSNALTYTVTTGARTNTVNARVTATGTNGTSGYGTASATIPLWTPFNLQNGWVDYSPPYASAAYTKTSSGLVFLKGLVKSGSGTIAVLPAGYRPNMALIFENSSVGLPGRIDIGPNGNFNMGGGDNGWTSLDGIYFMPGSPFTNVTTFLNGWTNFSPSSGDPNWQPAGSYLDPLGRVQMTGLIRAGTTTDKTVMFTLPVGQRPAEYAHILDHNSANRGIFGLNSSGGVEAKGYGNTYLSLQYMFYPSSRGTGTNCTTQWCALPLANGWVHYGAPNSTPQYTKSADGVVLLKGFIKGGSANNANIAVLPAGYCPKEQLLFATIANGEQARLDVGRYGDGTCFVVPNGNSTNWISLDNIRYIAEP